MLGAAAQPKTHLGVTTSQSIDKATENVRHTQTLVLQPSIRSSSLCNIADLDCRRVQINSMCLTRRIVTVCIIFQESLPARALRGTGADARSQTFLMATPSVAGDEHAARAEQLELVFCRYFQLYEQSRSLRAQLGKHMSDGYFNLTTARAKSRVCAFGEQDYIGRDFAASHRLAAREQAPDAPAAAPHVFWSPQKHESDEKADAPVVDPVTWFGILPPPGVKSCQQDYRAGAYMRYMGASCDNLVHSTFASVSL
jgi:hypothetical protein